MSLQTACVSVCVFYFMTLVCVCVLFHDPDVCVCVTVISSHGPDSLFQSVCVCVSVFHLTS